MNIYYFKTNISLCQVYVKGKNETHCRITIDVLQKSEVTKPSLLTNDIKMFKESCRQRETQEQKRIVRCQDSEF